MTASRLFTAALCLVTMISTACASTPAASQGFRCGPGFRTYTVVVQKGSTGGGVRCVKFINYQVIDGQIAGAYWYGEGTLNQYIYRHLGETWAVTDATGKTTVQSLASDIYGNGENAEFSANDLKLFPIEGQEHIQEVSEWPEQWLYEPSGVANYTSTLNPVKNCGRYFTKYALEGAAGVRCSMRATPESQDEFPYFVWYGDDGAGGRSGRHLGIVTRTAGRTAEAVAVAFCSRADCTSSPDSAVRLTLLNQCFQPFRIGVSGDWNQTWISPESLICTRP